MDYILVTRAFSVPAYVRSHYDKDSFIKTHAFFRAIHVFTCSILVVSLNSLQQPFNASFTMMLNQRGDIGRQSIFRSPIVLTLIGGILGVALYAGVVAKDASGTSTSACDFALGRSIATLAGTVSHYDASQPKDLSITSSKKLFQGLPREYERTYYAPCGKNCHPMIRALRQLGWEKVNSVEVARLVWSHYVDEELFKQLQPWQRYNHIPRDKSQAEEQHSWWKQYAKKHENRAYFMPETYILSDPQDRHDLHDRMKKSGNGKKQYWVMDRTVEEELEMKYYPPGSSEFDEFLKKVLVKDQDDQVVDAQLAKDREWTVQRFSCNPLVHKGMKIGVRSYFLVCACSIRAHVVVGVFTHCSF